MSHTRLSCAFVAFAALGTTTAHADEVFADDVIGQGNACFGFTCADGESFLSSITLKLHSGAVGIDFEDSTTAAGFPSNDWRLLVNDLNNAGIDRFSIVDRTHNTTPFTFEADVRDNAFYMNEFSNLGLGTSLPLADLHLSNLGGSEILLEGTGASPSQWRMRGDNIGFRLETQTGIDATTPFRIENDAPNTSFFMTSEGFVGLGTFDPAAQLELSSTDSFNFFRISATGAAVNDSVDITFTGGPLGTGQLRYNIVDGDNQEMSLDANGNMVLDGTLTTAGPTCAGGCDRVFDADYALPSIKEHASEMFAAGHLPSIGATIPHAPVNLSERQGRIINSLEHAHIYIDQLHDALVQERTRVDAQADMIANLMARLDAVEAR